MSRVRYIGAVLLTTLILVFALQNLGSVSVSMLLWDVNASVALIALGPFLVGFVVGSATTFIRARRARAREIKAGENLAALQTDDRSGPLTP